MSYHFFKELVEKHHVRFVDFRFTDSLGVLQHVTFSTDIIDEQNAREGFMFDGSSIKGWRGIEQSDMQLIPDLKTAYLDPFAAHPTLNVLCNIHCPHAKKAYEKDPRSIAQKAEAYLKKTGIADIAYFGPEAEFFMFDSVRFQSQSDYAFYELDSSESPHHNGSDLERGNLGHRPRTKEAYFPTPPIDHNAEIRSEMIETLKDIGIEVEKHHHEVAPAQHELGFKFGSLLEVADKLQNYKYIVKNVAESYGKTVTFMPKPVYGDNGSGMHCHQSLWKEGKPVFKGEGYAHLSQEALYYIGGILHHARSLNLFTNPTTNSYKRLVPGFEAPVIRAYSARNRSVACRIPSVSNPNARRIEVRFPDPAANPYLAFSAMLMAGLDGIKNKIDPGKADDRNLYALSEKEQKALPHLCASLGEAIRAVEEDYAYLLEGGVFTKEMLEAYIALKKEEVVKVEATLNPVEFELYYSV